MSRDAAKLADVIKKQQLFAFLAAVGQTITHWSTLDSILFEFFAFGLGTTKEKAATVYYESQTISQHLQMVDKLMLLSLSGKQLKTWVVLKKDILKTIPIRNQIAHDPLKYTPLEEFTLSELLQGKSQRSKLNPYEITTAEPKLLAKKAQNNIDSTKVVQHLHAVSDIITRMVAFRGALPRRARKQRAKSLPPKTLRTSGSKNSRRQQRKTRTSAKR